MTAPTGAIVRMRYDWSGGEHAPGEGDCLLTARGSAYEILDVREVRDRPNRFNLRCLKLAGAHEIPATAKIGTLRWYSRGRRST